MKFMKEKFFFIIILFASSVFSADIRSIPPLPTEFDFFIAPFPPLFCTSLDDPYVTPLHLEKIDISAYEIEYALDKEEKREFRKSLAHIKRAEELLESANEGSSNAKVYFRMSCATIPAPITGIGLYYLVYFPNAYGVLLKSVDGLREASLSINEGMGILANDFERLEYAGAGNYIGRASGVYNKIMDIIALSEENIEGEYETFGLKYMGVLKLTKSIQERLEKYPLSFSTQEDFPNSINWMIGKEENLFLLLVKLRREVKSALEDMENEYKELEENVEKDIRGCEYEVNTLTKEEYGVIDEELVYFFADNSSLLIDESTSKISPKDRLTEIKYLLSNPGINLGAKQIFSKAREVHSAKRKYYLAEGINELNKVSLRLQNIKLLILEVKEDVNSVINNAEERVEERDKEISNLILIFSPKNEVEVGLLKDAGLLKNEADKELERAKKANTGKKLQIYKNILLTFSNIESILSHKNTYLELKRKEVKKKIEKLNEVMEYASKDEIDVSYEREQAEAIGHIIDVSNETEAESILNILDSLIEGIYEKAEARFYYVDELRSKISSIFTLIKPIPEGLNSEYLEFERNEEKFVQEGKISPKLTLGNYKKLTLFYEKTLNKIQSYANKILSDFISTHSTAKLFFPPPILDSETEITIEINMHNKLELYSDTPISIKFPFSFPFSSISENIVLKSDNILDIAINEGMISVLFESISPNSFYYATIKMKKKLANKISDIEKVNFITPEVVKKTRKIKFYAEIDMDVLRVVLPWSIDASISPLYKNMEMEYIRNTTSLEILLTNVKKGENELIIEYSIFEPFNINKTNISIETEGITSKISFNIEITTKIDLENIPIILFEFTNTTPNDIVVLSISGNIPKNLKIDSSENGFSAKWFVPYLKANSTSLYKVSFSIDDLSSYATALYNEVSTIISAKNASELFDELYEAKALLLERKYKKSIEKLVELKARALSVPKESPKNLLLDEIERLSSLQGKLNWTKNSFLNLGYFEYANDIENAINEAEQAKKNALYFIEKNKLSEAANAISKGIEKLQKLNFNKEVIRKREELIHKLNKVKENLFLLFQLENMSREFELLRKAESYINDIDEKLREEEYGHAFENIVKAEEIIKNISKGIELACDNKFSSLLLLSSEFEEEKKNTYEILNKLDTALSVSVNKDIIKYTKISFSSFSSDSLRKEIAPLISHLSNLFKNLEGKKNRTEFILANSHNIALVQTELNKFKSIKEAANSNINYLSKKAEEALKTAEMALAQLIELAPKDEKYVNEINNLNSKLISSKNSMEKERFVDSIFLSSYIQKRAAYIIKHIPQKEETQDQSLILIVSALFFIILLVLFLRKKPIKKEPLSLRKLPYSSSSSSSSISSSSHSSSSSSPSSSSSSSNIFLTSSLGF